VKLLENGEIWFDSLIKSGGASVFRIYAKNSSVLEQVRTSLLDLGCPSEVDAKAGLIALEVPLERNIAPVLDFLMSGQHANLFDFEEGALRHAI
jgi:hypothetical protein